MISITGISKNYGQQVLYQNASLQIRPGEKIGLVGPNGAGKSTIFRLIMGHESVEQGVISIPDRCVLGYFSQDVGEMHGRSALEEVKAGAGRVSELSEQVTKLEKDLQDEASGRSEEDTMKLVEKYSDALSEFQARGGYDLDSRAKEILTGLGIGPADYDRPVESFSGGWKMRIALARILVLQPDVLLMDEPTNHLDLESIVWLEEWLKSFPGSLLMTSHDHDFMNRLVDRVIEVANKNIVSYSGNYAFYEREKKIRHEQLLASFRRQQDMLAKEEEFIARFGARASHAAQVQSRVKKLDKIERIEIPPEERVMSFVFPDTPRSGNDVVKFQNLSKTWVGQDSQGATRTKQVFHGLTGMVRYLDKIAVVGVNGAGKSTLLKVVTEQTEPTEGRLTLGAGVKVGYFSQHALEVLDPRKTIMEEIHDRLPTATLGFIRNLLGAFLFSGDDAEKKIGILSGGEKSRVVLATILAQPVNFLVLDEPTNHLDIRSREMLLDAIKNFDGTVMMVSHDRWFLRECTKRVFEIRDGEMHTYDGTYNEYLQRRKP